MTQWYDKEHVRKCVKALVDERGALLRDAMLGELHAGRTPAFYEIVMEELGYRPVSGEAIHAWELGERSDHTEAVEDHMVEISSELEAVCLAYMLKSMYGVESRLYPKDDDKETR